MFPNLEHLTLEGSYELGNKASSVAIGNLLRCCPVLRDLQLKLSMKPKICQGGRIGSKWISQPDVRKFMNWLKSCIMQMISPELPGLKDCSFTCLQSHLRRVKLQFGLGKPNRFEVQLAEFLRKNAVVLEEIHVVNGD